MITRNKKPPSLARMCISVINLYLPVMAVTEFQAFGAGRWFRIWCSFPIQERWGTLGVTVKKCLRHTPDMDIHASHFSTASNSTLYGSVPYMETLPRTKGGGVWFRDYQIELGYIMEIYPIKRSYCDNTYNMIMGLSSSSLSIGGIFNVLAIYSNVMYSGLVTSLRLST